MWLFVASVCAFRDLHLSCTQNVQEHNKTLSLLRKPRRGLLRFFISVLTQPTGKYKMVYHTAIIILILSLNEINCKGKRTL